jgi:predicted glycoside hydrolase/deacetylase ChbG (UPF0249 family)
MFKLIINADDFGLTEGINDGIIALASARSISSTTVMVNMPHAEQIIQLAKQEMYLGIGLHLNLTEGKPIQSPSLVPSLVKPNGDFWPYAEFRRRAFNNMVSRKEIQNEIECQMGRLDNLIGSRVDHIDSHQNIHKLAPVADALLSARIPRQALKIRCPTRMMMLQSCSRVFLQSSLSTNIRQHRINKVMVDLYLRWIARKLKRRFAMPDGEIKTQSMKKEDLINTLYALSPKDHDNGIYEMVCHPSINSYGLAHSKLAEFRTQEFKLLSSKRFNCFIASIQLFTFKGISLP